MSTTKCPAIVGAVSGEPAIASEPGFQGSEREVPWGFVVSYVGRLYIIRIWVDRLSLVVNDCWYLKSNVQGVLWR